LKREQVFIGKFKFYTNIFIIMASLDELTREIIKMRKMLRNMEKKVDALKENQIRIENSLERLKEITELIENFPVKLNTTTYQITSQLEEKTAEMEKNLRERVEESLAKMDELVEINKRLDIFEENMDAYLSKIRYMLMEMEDSLRRR